MYIFVLGGIHLHRGTQATWENYMECKDEHEILVFGPTAWGRGKSIKQALSRCKTNVPKSVKKPRFIAYLCPAGAGVDGMGGIVTQEGEMPPICLGEV